MDTNNQSPERFLVNCENEINNVERATISFVLETTASKTCETAVFATSDASVLCTKGGADSLVATRYEPSIDRIDSFINNGGQSWLCPACAKAKSISEQDLIAGVQIAGAPRTMAYLASGARLLA